MPIPPIKHIEKLLHILGFFLNSLYVKGAEFLHLLKFLNSY